MKDRADNGTAPETAIGGAESGIRPAAQMAILPTRPSVTPSAPPPAGRAPSLAPPPPAGIRGSVPPPPAGRAQSLPPALPPSARTGSFPPPIPPSARTGSLPPVAATPRTASVPPPLPARAPASSSIPPRSPSLPPAPPPRRDDGLQALAKVHAELRTMQIEVDRLRVQIKGREAHIAELKATLASRVEEFDRQRADNHAKEQALVAKDQTIADRDKTLSAKDQALADKDKALSAKDAEITALRQQLSSAPAPVVEGDDLKRVKGIGPGFERILKQNGVTTYAHMAAWSGDDIMRFAALLNTQPGRIARGAWIEQAAALASGTTLDT